MKTLISIISIIAFITLNIYGQDKDVSTLLANPESRNEIINSILNNHDYMTEFIQAMHGNEHAMMMMNSGDNVEGNNQMMMGSGNHWGMSGDNQIMDRNSMMNLMHQNPGMMQMMMGNMMDVVSSDSTMTNQMVNMMTSHPEIMQSMHRYNNDNTMESAHGNKMMPPEDTKENMGQMHHH
jgi:hypothetical protein